MSEPTAAIMSNVVSKNKVLRYLDLSSNRLGEVIDFLFLILHMVIMNLIFIVFILGRWQRLGQKHLE
jgi:hypothetical protein